MIFTAKNSQKYLENYHYIDIPRSRIFATLLLHYFFLNIGMVMFYSYFAIGAVPIIAWEIYYIMTFVRILWRRFGYSQVLFVIILAVNIVIDFFLSFAERWLIGQLLKVIISEMGGY